MIRRPGVLVLAAGLVLFSGARVPAHAVQARLWRCTDPSELARGLAEGVSLGPRGTIALAPRLDSLSPDIRDGQAQPIIWSSVLDGERLVVGSGDDGRILRIGPEGKAEVLAVLDEPHVTALALSPSGQLIAGTSPQGAIYRISPEGDVEELFDPKERYIWSLAVSRDGKIYVGTGERGRIYRVDSEGDGTLFFDGDDPHIVSLAFDRQGRLLAGTEGNGLLVRFDASGHPSILLDSDEREVAAVAVDGAGNIYASTFSESRRQQAFTRELTVRLGPAAEGPLQTSPLPGAVPPVEWQGSPEEKRRGVTGIIEEAASASSSSQQGPSPATRSVLYRLSPEGKLDQVWVSQSEDIYSLAAGPEGSVWIGTGSPARVRRLDQPGQASIVAYMPETQVTSLLLDRSGRLFVTTGNAGSVYALGPQIAREGSFLGAPLDGRFVSTWGRVFWDAQMPEGGRLEIQTRTGSSPLPDSSWSEWSAPYSDPSGSLIASPPGRYLQWRVRLRGGGRGGSDSPVVRSVTLSSLPRNRAPRIGEVTVPPADQADPKVSATPTDKNSERPGEGTPGADRNLRFALFSAEDPDGDPLTFRLSAKPLDGRGAEREIAQKGEAGPPISWDDTQLPEGRWVLVVRASDEKSNPPGTDLFAQSESLPFEVDRTPPVLTAMTVGAGARSELRIQASDALSAIARAEYSFDGKQWRSAAVADGILDSWEEQILLPPDAAGRGVQFRVRDTAGNEARIDVPAGPAPAH